ncbi:MAG: family 16 glycoside hydrolase [Planctomycetota bacterium]
MNKRMKVMVGVLAFALCVCCLPKANAASKENWKLGMQAYSFNRFTFFEAVDKNKALEMKYIEAYPGQKLSKEHGDAKFDHNMSSELRKVALQKLRKEGVKLINYGVVGLPNNEAECRKVFDFAKEMGIETIVSEPPEDAFELIDKLCNEYKIKVAIHNHPRPSHYWDPDTVLKVCKGRSNMIGACADTGHWTRSGINPLEAIKKLKGRIISSHLKDLNTFGINSAHDVVWGTGVSLTADVLAELKKQGYKGSFSIEYEHNWLNSMPEISGCVAFFRKTTAALSDAPYKNVFKKDLSNAVMPGDSKWVIGGDGVLTPAKDGHGDIWTKERYGNFILELDFKVPEGGNSGVFIRTGSIQNWINTAIEVQIHATTDGAKHGQCGAIYDCLSPSKTAVKKPGEWNHYIITCLDNKIYVNLNGEDIIDMDLNLWTEAGKNPDPPEGPGTKNKFRIAYKDMSREGHLGFQYHGNPIWFKNLKIKSFD